MNATYGTGSREWKLQLAQNEREEEEKENERLNLERMTSLIAESKRNADDADDEVCVRLHHLARRTNARMHEGARTHACATRHFAAMVLARHTFRSHGPSQAHISQPWS